MLGKYRWVILYGIGMFSFVLLFFMQSQSRGRGAFLKVEELSRRGGGAEENNNDKCMVIFAILYTCAEN